MRRKNKVRELKNLLQLDFFIQFADSIWKKVEEKKEDKPKSKVDISKYNLIYIRKTDERKFLVRAITKMDYSVIDTVTGEVFKMTQAKLKARMKPNKELNKLNKNKRSFLNFSRKRAS